MAQGIQIWDAAGVNIVDTSTLMGIYLGYITIPTTTPTGSITVPEFAMTGVTPWANYVNNSFDGIRNMKITISGTTLSWEARAQTGTPGTDKYGFLMYGIR
jgi:hypothetical protein